MSNIKVIIFEVVALDIDEATKVISDLNQERIYRIGNLSNPTLLTMYLLAISVNECAAINHDQCPIKLDNLDGSNVEQYKQNIKYYLELYDRDIAACTMGDYRDYEPYVAVMTIDDIYVGHTYFWTISDIYNIMGIRASLQHQAKKVDRVPVAIHLLSAIRRWLARRYDGMLYRLVAPFSQMTKLALKLGMIEEQDYPGFPSILYEDGYIGEGPITCEDEAVCGRQVNPVSNSNIPLNGENQLSYQLVDLINPSESE